MDDFNYAELQALQAEADYKFHSLLSHEKVRQQAEQVAELLTEIDTILRDFADPIDAIVGFWDFPVSLMVPYLCERYDLPGATVREAVMCEHKYWSRLKQREVIPDHIPNFCAVDPFADNPLQQIDLDFPFWLKPIKATASQLGFRITDRASFDDAITEIRAEIASLGEPFNFFLNQVDLPDSIAEITGNHCIAEEIIGGDQYTVSGYVFAGEAAVFGVVDSITYPDTSSFYSYEYPSRLPEAVQDRARSVALTVMNHIGFNNSPFNIEFFYDTDRDQLWLLEINTRISQSHSALYEKVDSQPNFKVMLDIGLGQHPQFVEGQGEYAYAGKFFLRTFDHADAYVAAVPDQSVLQQVQREVPDARIHIVPDADMHLSELYDQDSYSYELAHVYIGADTHAALRQRYQRCAEILRPAFLLKER